MSEFNAFITGSQVYGNPTDESDLDLVVLVKDSETTRLLNLFAFYDEQTLVRKKDWFWVRWWKRAWNRTNGPGYLKHIKDQTISPDPAYGWNHSVRFGRLNIIMISNEQEFQAWKIATDELIKRKPVTRLEAVQEIEDFKQILREL